jgi:hypothetical protein
VNAHSKPGRTEAGQLAEANQKLRAKSPANRAKLVAELESKLAEVKGDLVLITRKLTALGAALKATAPVAKANKPAEDPRPFYARSEAHKAAWERFHKRPAPKK